PSAAQLLAGPARGPGRPLEALRSATTPHHHKVMSVSPLNSGSTALLTDHYELTMLQATLASGHADRPCVFEAFARRLPEGRRYGVVAGTGRFLDALASFTFGAEEIDFLRSTRVVDDTPRAYLGGYRTSVERPCG